MTKPKTERLKLLRVKASILKAMAHPSRLLIMEELAQKERCVHELTATIGADMSTVSKHLSILKNSGIVDDEKRGLQVFYSLQMPCLLKVFDCVKTVIQRNARKQKEFMK